MDDDSFSSSSSSLLEMSDGGSDDDGLIIIGDDDEIIISTSLGEVIGQSLITVVDEGNHHPHGVTSSSSSLLFGHPMDVVDDDSSSQYYYYNAQKQVRQWVLQVPIGLGLCPWAGKSHGKGNLRYVTCMFDNPLQVMELVYSEIERLLVSTSSGGGGEREEEDGDDDDDNDDDSWKYSTTLLICPFVREWKDFEAFEQFVNNGCLISARPDGAKESEQEFRHRIQSYEEKRLHFQNRITLVPFHPEFIRWRGLPEGMGVGTTVQSYWGMVGSKSGVKASATIIETENKVFGKQKVKIRFHEELEGRRLEQYVPIDWILSGTEELLLGPPLPDNAMHQAPYPTIHLIANQDLVSLSIRDISRVKRKNAQRMMKLGWSGVEKAIGENEFLSTTSRRI